MLSKKSQAALRLISRRKTKHATIARRYALRPVAEVTGEFIALGCFPPHICGIPSGIRSVPPSILPVIPIVRAPDDPGIDDEPGRDEFAEQIGPAPGQAGGWRGFLSRWGG